jgi:hypothetical protein
MEYQPWKQASPGKLSQHIMIIWHQIVLSASSIDSFQFRCLFFKILNPTDTVLFIQPATQIQLLTAIRTERNNARFLIVELTIANRTLALSHRYVSPGYPLQPSL